MPVFVGHLVYIYIYIYIYIYNITTVYGCHYFTKWVCGRPNVV